MLEKTVYYITKAPLGEAMNAYDRDLRICCTISSESFAQSHIKNLIMHDEVTDGKKLRQNLT